MVYNSTREEEMNSKGQLNALMRAEFKKVFGQTLPNGWTPKQIWEYAQHVRRKIESDKAFHAVFLKSLNLSEKDFKRAEHDADLFFFWGIGNAKNRNLNAEWVKKRLINAIEENDLKFFTRFGDALKRKPRSAGLDKVAFLLALRWEMWSGKIPPYSYFTDEALLEMLKIDTGNECHQLDQIRKTRQRLGLATKNTDFKVRKVERAGKAFKLVLVDKSK